MSRRTRCSHEARFSSDSVDMCSPIARKCSRIRVSWTRGLRLGGTSKTECHGPMPMSASPRKPGRKCGTTVRTPQSETCHPISSHARHSHTSPGRQTNSRSPSKKIHSSPAMIMPTSYAGWNTTARSFARGHDQAPSSQRARPLLGVCSYTGDSKPSSMPVAFPATANVVPLFYSFSGFRYSRYPGWRKTMVAGRSTSDPEGR